EAVAADSLGFTYAGGLSYSQSFPVLNAFQPTKAVTNVPNGFLTKIPPDGGTPIYSTYVGDNGEVAVRSVVVDSTFSPTVAGEANFTGLPVMNALQGARDGGVDGFITRFNASATALVYSTYLGGHGDD